MVRCQLDRGCANPDLIAMFPNLEVTHLSSSHSDHVPISLDQGANRNLHQTVKQWYVPRYHPYWIMDNDFVAVFDNSLNNSGIIGSPEALTNHIADVWGDLRSWSNFKHINLKKNISCLQEELHDLRNLMDYDYNLEKELIKKIEHLYLLEEEYWRTREKRKWLRRMDKNTTYFHHKASARHTRNMIAKIQDSEGRTHSEATKLQSIARDYFSDLYTIGGSNVDLINTLPIMALSQRANEILSAPLTEAEILTALRKMLGNKYLGPDGFHMVFLQKCWGLIGDDIIKIILNCLNNGGSIKGLNETFILLIPKVKKALNMKQFHPISLCNTTNKLLSKTLSNRLKVVMNDLISDNQSAFIKDCLITDNIMCAFEVFHSMTTGAKGCDRHMALKLDMAKTFDRVEWPFVEKNPKCYGLTCSSYEYYNAVPFVRVL